MADAHVRPDVRAFLDWLNALPGPRAHEVEPAEGRAMLLASRHVADAEVGDLALIRDIAGGPAPMRLYDARAERGPGPLLLFFHGGGFVLGGLDTHEPFCAEIARLLDLPVLAVDYRLAPEHPFPAGIEDSIAAARWAAESPEAIGREATGLVLCGDSAGGNFAIVVGLELRDRPAAAPVLAQWLIYPAASPDREHPSLEAFGEGHFLTREAIRWFDLCYDGKPEDWRYAPLRGSQAGMPPTLVLTAGLDPIRDQGRAYAAACIEAGVDTHFLEARGNIHGFICLRKAIPSSEADIRACTDVLKLMLEEAGR